MAEIKISSQTMQSLVDDYVDIEVSSFSWTRGSKEPDIEFEFVVNDTVEYEDEDYIDLAVHEELQSDFEELKDEHDKMMAEFEQLKIEHAEMMAAYQALVGVPTTPKPSFVRRLFGRK